MPPISIRLSTAAPFLLIVVLLPRLPAVAAGERESGAGTQGVSAFEAEHFASAAPANAYDMVLRLPGFSIVEADTDVRGYSGARGNVLIDGTQPTSRREDVVSMLRRIPAASVRRIELIRGGAPGVDMGGHAVLANVVRGSEAPVEMALEVGAAGATDGWLAPQAQFEYASRRGERMLEFALWAEPELDEDTGPGRLRRFDPDGMQTTDLDTDVRSVDDLYGATANWRQPLAGGSLGLDAALRVERENERERRTGRASGALVETASDAEDLREIEFGGRWMRDIGERSRLELLLGQRWGRLEALSLSEQDEGQERFEEYTDSGETVARVELGHAPSDRLRLTASLEGAFNFLEGDARLSDADGEVAVPGSDVRIEERRMEAALGATWQPVGAWTLEAGLRVETSELQQTGDSELRRDFVYPKPRLTAFWKPDERNGFHLSLSREVGQLDFEEFMASASFDTGVVSAGNPDLEPDKTWQLVAGWERRFGADGALGLTWIHERIEDVVDRVLVSGDGQYFDAPGNIGDGRRDTLELELSTLLDSIGMTGFRLSALVAWQASSVTDPTTGERRGISEEAPLEGEIRLVQALPDSGVTWGAAVELAQRERKYSYDEIGIERIPLSWQLFAERELGNGWRMRGEVRDLLGARHRQERSRYDGPRSGFGLGEREYRGHRMPGTFLLTVRRSLGG